MIQKQIIVIDKVEDGTDYNGKPCKKVTDKAGDLFTVKRGQGNKLQEKWPLLQEGKAIQPVWDTYQNKPFIKDFELVEDAFLIKAQEKLDEGEAGERQKSICASYATDIEVALIGQGKPFSEPRVCATTTMFYRLITTNELDMEVKDDKTKENIPKATGKTRQEDVPPEWTVKDYVEALRNQDYKAWWRDWAKQFEVDGKPILEKTLEAMNIEQLYELKKKLKGVGK